MFNGFLTVDGMRVVQPGSQSNRSHFVVELEEAVSPILVRTVSIIDKVEWERGRTNVWFGTDCH